MSFASVVLAQMRRLSPAAPSARTRRPPRIVARVILPEQAHGRIPGAVVAVEQPAPIGQTGQHDPGRAPERAREMGDAGAYCNDEVEAGDERRGLDKVGQVGREVDDVGALAQQRLVVRPWIFLQAHEGRIDIEERRQGFERHRTMAVVALFGIAGPDQAERNVRIEPLEAVAATV